MAKKEILNNDVLTLRVGETAADILAETSDVIGQTLDVIENQVDRVVTVTKNNPFVLAGVLVIGVALGGFVAYKIATKRTTRMYEDTILPEQLAAAKSFRQRLAKEGEYESPESAVQALIPEEIVEVVQAYQGRGKVPYNNPKDIVVAETPVIEVETVEVTQNVFATSHTPDLRDWDYRLEIADREANPNVPYVISFDEFHENSDNHEQVTLGYYAEDDTLTDERDTPIDNTDYTVGDDNLTRFGQGSNDPAVVYVRNEKISMDFEIIRSEGSYAHDVLGLNTPDSSLRHSHGRTSRRFRGTDE